MNLVCIICLRFACQHFHWENANRLMLLLGYVVHWIPAVVFLLLALPKNSHSAHGPWRDDMQSKMSFLLLDYCKMAFCATTQLATGKNWKQRWADQRNWVIHSCYLQPHKVASLRCRPEQKNQRSKLSSTRNTWSLKLHSKYWVMLKIEILCTF